MATASSRISRLDGLTLAVVEIELGGKFRRRVASCAPQQIGTQSGASHPPAGIDARPEDKTQMMRVKGGEALATPASAANPGRESLES